MYLIRRAAARTVFLQPARQLSTLRSSSARLSPFQSAKPTVARSFHQSRIWRAEDERKPIDANTVGRDTTGETVAEGSKNEAVEAAEVAESAAKTADLAEEAVESAASGDAAAEATETAEEAAAVAEGAADAAEVAANTADQTSSVDSEAAGVAAEASRAATFAAGTAAAAATAAAHTAPHFPPNDAPVGNDFRNAQPTRIIYIGNLFFEVTTQHLEAEFGKFGQLTNSRVVTDPRGMSKGFGYVEFATQEAADRAVRESDQKVFQGRRMAVQYHARRERGSRPGRVGASPTRTPHEPTKTLFIGNMSYQMSDRDLNDLFREVTDVLDVRVAIDRRTGQPRGFAHADFTHQEAADRAKAVLENKVVYGRQLRVDYSASSSAAKQEPRF